MSIQPVMFLFTSVKHPESTVETLLFSVIRASIVFAQQPGIPDRCACKIAEKTTGNHFHNFGLTSISQRVWRVCTQLWISLQITRMECLYWKGLFRGLEQSQSFSRVWSHRHLMGFNDFCWCFCVNLSISTVFPILGSLVRMFQHTPGTYEVLRIINSLWFGIGVCSRVYGRSGSLSHSIHGHGIFP